MITLTELNSKQVTQLRPAGGGNVRQVEFCIGLMQHQPQSTFGPRTRSPRDKLHLVKRERLVVTRNPDLLGAIVISNTMCNTFGHMTGVPLLYNDDGSDSILDTKDITCKRCLNHLKGMSSSGAFKPSTSASTSTNSPS